MCSTDFCKHKEKDISLFQRPDDLQNTPDESEEDIIINRVDYWRDSIHDLFTEDSDNLRKGGSSLKEIGSLTESLLKDLFLYLNRIAERSNRLIGNFTSNLAESWMNIRCKFDGGKMYNKCFKGSFCARCYGGALRCKYMLFPVIN